MYTMAKETKKNLVMGQNGQIDQAMAPKMVINSGNTSRSAADRRR